VKVQLQDQRKTETGLDLNQSRPEIIRTDRDRNHGPVFGPSSFWKIKDRAKTGLSSLNRSFGSFQPQTSESLNIFSLLFLPRKHLETGFCGTRRLHGAPGRE
jgi:hypothetical protein